MGTRRSILFGLGALFVSTLAKSQLCNPGTPNSSGCKAIREYERELKAMPKWYITIPGCTKPLAVHGRDRLDAVANSGITVWSESEWVDAQKELNR